MQDKANPRKDFNYLLGIWKSIKTSALSVRGLISPLSKVYPKYLVSVQLSPSFAGFVIRPMAQIGMSGWTGCMCCTQHMVPAWGICCMRHPAGLSLHAGSEPDLKHAAHRAGASMWGWSRDPQARSYNSTDWIWPTGHILDNRGL